jgi:hypothetical protein
VDSDHGVCLFVCLGHVVTIVQEREISPKDNCKMKDNFDTSRTNTKQMNAEGEGTERD